MAHKVKIKKIENLTHDVLSIVLEKPEGITYVPGQAADFALGKEGWENEWRTFTFVSLPSDDFIEFNIKTYTDHKGVTNELRSAKVGDEIIIGDVYGDINYKGEGVFLAGGAGITPFIAILKDLEKKNQLGNNKLIFGNKTKGDIVRKDLFDDMLGKNFINVISDEEIEGFEHGFVNREIIEKYSNPDTKYYYLCGPPPMMNAVEKLLAELGVKEENVVKEGF